MIIRFNFDNFSIYPIIHIAWLPFSGLQALFPFSIK